jgi:hypothetical protein
MLLPESVVRRHLPSPPVVAAGLKKLAQKAKVSELAVAIRVANLAQAIGLLNASVAFFKDGDFEWQWSPTLTMTKHEAKSLLEEAKKSAPRPARILQPLTSDIVVASIIANPGFASATLFVQLFPPDIGRALSQEERRRDLEKLLFDGDEKFRMQLQGVFGAFRPQCSGSTLDIAFAEFYRLKGHKWSGVAHQKLHSAKGREYVRLRLSEWCK